MVDNRGISPVGGSYFKSDNANANKMSDEKYGQGGEYFANEFEEETEENHENYQDRSAQLRASLNGLAIANVGSIRVMKAIREKDRKPKNKKNKDSKTKTQKETQEEIVED